MKHAGQAALDSVEPVLQHLRRLQGVREKKRGVFYRGAAAFIHFHEDPAGIFADLRSGSEWERLRVSTEDECEQLLRRVGEILVLAHETHPRHESLTIDT